MAGYRSHSTRTNVHMTPRGSHGGYRRGSVLARGVDVPGVILDSPTDISSQGFTLTWEPSGVGDADHYELQISISPEFDVLASGPWNWQQINTDQYVVHGLDYDITYFCRVRAVAQGKSGAWSNVVWAMTYVLAAPILLEAEDVINVGFTLRWTWDGDGRPPSHYILQVAADPIFTMFCIGDWNGTNIYDQYWVVTGLDPQSTYYCRVMGVLDGMDSEWSNVVEAETVGSTLLSPIITLSEDDPITTESLHEIAAGSDVGEAIYYTTNGDIPTTDSTLYVGPFAIDSPTNNVTIKAIAILEGWTDSEVAVSDEFDVLGLLLAPIITLSTDDPITTESLHGIAAGSDVGEAIYYTTNGDDPTAASTLYTGPFAITDPAEDVVIKAIAILSGYVDSDISISDEFAVSIPYPTEGGLLYNGYMYHIFEADGELDVLDDVDVDVLLIGGGGGNGGTYTNWGTGAGGAGGVIEDNVSLTPGTYEVNVGLGGEIRNNGGNTTAFGFTAIGGGCGGKRTDLAPNDGGSGGGAPSWFNYSVPQPFYPGGAPVVGHGHKGGDSDVSGTTTHQGSQGGGGYVWGGEDRLTARDASANNSSGTDGGRGKLLSEIFDFLGSGANIGLAFDGVAGGGGGASGSTNTTIGLGGGVVSNPYGAGDGGHATLSPTPTIDGTGSGAGGAAATIDTIEGRSCGRGGDGIAIVRYEVGVHTLSPPIITLSADSPISIYSLHSIAPGSNVGEAIYYTTNGDNPTSSSTLYTAPFAIDTPAEDVVIQAIAILAGCGDSEVAASAAFSSADYVTPWRMQLNAAINYPSFTVKVSRETIITCDGNAEMMDRSFTYGTGLKVLTLAANTGYRIYTCTGTSNVNYVNFPAAEHIMELAYSGSYNAYYTPDPIGPMAALEDISFNGEGGLTGSITGKPLKVANLTNAINVTGELPATGVTNLILSYSAARYDISGDISGYTGLTYLNVKLYRAVTGDITGKPLGYLYLDNCHITGELGASASLNNVNINNMGDKITIGGDFIGAVRSGASAFTGTTRFTPAEYAKIFEYYGKDGSWYGTKSLTISDGGGACVNSPGYDTAQGGVKTHFDAIIAKGAIISIPSAWIGGAFPNDFPA